MKPSRQPAPVDGELIDLFRARDGHLSTVLLVDGRRLQVLDIAWGYDWQDEYAYVTTNWSPGLPGLSIDFFFTSKVLTVLGDGGAVLYQRWLRPMGTERRPGVVPRPLLLDTGLLVAVELVPTWPR